MTSEITKLKYVLTLAEELNFSRAAQRLQISQPTLSQHISKLEGEMGVSLFDRSSSCIKLTDAGELYVEAIRSVYDKLSETMDRISDLEENGACRLSVGTSPSLAHYIIPDLVKTIKDKYPKSTVNIYEATTNELNVLLDKGVVDIALCVTNNDAQVFGREVIYDEKILLAVPVKSEYYDIVRACAHDGVVSFSEAAQGVQFISLQDDQVLAKNLYSLSRECGVSVQVSVTVSELTTAVEMLRRGLGVMLIPSTLRRYLAAERELEFFEVDRLSGTRSIAVHYRRDKYLSNVSRFFINSLKALEL